MTVTLELSPTPTIIPTKTESMQLNERYGTQPGVDPRLHIPTETTYLDGVPLPPAMNNFTKITPRRTPHNALSQPLTPRNIYLK